MPRPPRSPCTDPIKNYSFNSEKGGRYTMDARTELDAAIKLFAIGLILDGSVWVVSNTSGHKYSAEGLID